MREWQPSMCAIAEKTEPGRLAGRGKENEEKYRKEEGTGFFGYESE